MQRRGVSSRSRDSSRNSSSSSDSSDNIEVKICIMCLRLQVALLECPAEHGICSRCIGGVIAAAADRVRLSSEFHEPIGLRCPLCAVNIPMKTLAGVVPEAVGTLCEALVEHARKQGALLAAAAAARAFVQL